MSNEELERAIEFLLKSQAAFEASLAADREAFRERQAAFEANLAADREAFRKHEEASIAEHERMSARQDRTQRHLDHLSTVVAHIAEITQRNSEDIDALVKLVGGVIERGNGKPEN
ncbi:MAG TPA: hypothetical protein VK388_14425 [Pyrinomonadaceae bacterium]|nr:hypothetical protein [Pyrinomonadaceae bacterium]